MLYWISITSSYYLRPIYPILILFYFIKFFFLSSLEINLVSFVLLLSDSQYAASHPFPSLLYLFPSLHFPSFPFIYFPLLYSCFQHHIMFSPSALYHIPSLYLHFACPSSTPLHSTPLHCIALHCNVSFLTCTDNQLDKWDMKPDHQLNISLMRMAQ